MDKRVANEIVSLVFNTVSHDSRVLKEAATLQNAGYCVTIAGLYAMNLIETELLGNGVQIKRLHLKTGFINVKNLGAFLKKLEFTIKIVWSYRKSTLIHCNDLEMLPIGVIIKLLFNKNVKIIYDAHEYETEIARLKLFKRDNKCV